MARTNIDIDDKLLSEALKVTRLKTKKELVNFALEELIRRAGRKRMQKLEGKVLREGILVYSGTATGNLRGTVRSHREKRLEQANKQNQSSRP